MKANRKLSTILLVIILSGAANIGQGRAVASEMGIKGGEVGTIAPEFMLTSYDGKSVRLSDYKDKIVVLEWFNYECPFVKHHYEQAGTMTKLAEKYKDKNVVWLAINSTAHQTTDKNREFAQKYEIGYPILDDRTGKTGHAYGAKTTPHMFIIDGEGMIVYAGAIDNSPLGKVKENVVNYVDQALNELTSGKSVTIANTKPYGCSVKYAQ